MNQLPVGGSAQAGMPLSLWSETVSQPREDERALRLSLLTRGQSEGGQSGGTGAFHCRVMQGTAGHCGCGQDRRLRVRSFPKSEA